MNLKDREYFLTGVPLEQRLKGQLYTADDDHGSVLWRVKEGLWNWTKVLREFRHSNFFTPSFDPIEGPLEARLWAMNDGSRPKKRTRREAK